MDADNESYIQEAITQLCRGKTLLVIAHRLNTIRHADEILVIDQGRIVQAGDHDKLMAEEGIYRRFITARSIPPVGAGKHSEPNETERMAGMRVPVILRSTSSLIYPRGHAKPIWRHLAISCDKEYDVVSKH